MTARGDGLRVGDLETGPSAVIVAAGPLRMGGRVLSAVAVVERTGAGLRLIEELPLDDYVAGVVSGELPASFPAEAQKAQAVAARTYALVKKIEAEGASRSFHLGANVLSQVYVGGAPNPGRARRRRRHPRRGAGLRQRAGRGLLPLHLRGPDRARPRRPGARRCPTWCRSPAATATTRPAPAGRSPAAAPSWARRWGWPAR